MYSHGRAGRAAAVRAAARASRATRAAPQAIPMLVAVRLRPMWDKELEKGDYSCVRVVEGNLVVVIDPWYDADLNKNRDKEKRYAFDKVFDEAVGQEEVFEQTAHGLMTGVLDGYNASVFAYGATGAGKTHTMLGNFEDPGVMVLTLHDMFNRMKEPAFADAKFKVTLSYMEIYNELIKDLLQPSALDLKLNEDPVRGMVVQGITDYCVDSATEILELLHRGNLHRTTEPTAANQVSSRSHAVLQVTVEQAERTAHVTGNLKIGKLSLVDLAGSERASKTDNKGIRLKEGANINRSLLALGNCITALADSKKKGHVPFRDSKMTRLLKDSLGGNCRTVMIANISGSHRQFEETINTLKYANRAKNLKTQVARNVMSVSAHIAEYQRIIMELRNEVADLKAHAASKPAAVYAKAEDAAIKRDRTKQRAALDFVDNLEKQHMQNIRNAVMQACAERRQLLQNLTKLTQTLSEAPSSSSGGHDVAAEPTGGDAGDTRDAIAGVRKQLQQNQQVVMQIMETAMSRIGSSERLQLLQLLVRGQFIEVLNEQFFHELDLRRSLTQAAMAQGMLPAEMMSQAMLTEAWHTEHRPAMDFHQQMAQVEIGGSLNIPSIAQLLDENLLSPQQATSSQNLGELVRPFTTKRRPAPKPRSNLEDASRAAPYVHEARSPNKESGPGGPSHDDASRSSNAPSSFRKSALPACSQSAPLVPCGNTHLPSLYSAGNSAIAPAACRSGNTTPSLSLPIIASTSKTPPVGALSNLRRRRSSNAAATDADGNVIRTAPPSRAASHQSSARRDMGSQQGRVNLGSQQGRVNSQQGSSSVRSGSGTINSDNQAQVQRLQHLHARPRKPQAPKPRGVRHVGAPQRRLPAVNVIGERAGVPAEAKPAGPSLQMNGSRAGLVQRSGGQRDPYGNKGMAALPLHPPRGVVAARSGAVPMRPSAIPVAPGVRMVGRSRRPSLPPAAPSKAMAAHLGLR